jgi:hypothetical protein
MHTVLLVSKYNYLSNLRGQTGHCVRPRSQGEGPAPVRWAVHLAGSAHFPRTSESAFLSLTAETKSQAVTPSETLTGRPWKVPSGRRAASRTVLRGRLVCQCLGLRRLAQDRVLLGQFK